MSERTFRSLQFRDMGGLVNAAERRVVFGAPGLDQGLAAALVRATERLGRGNVAILLDVAEENCRVGYGQCEGYGMLIENGVVIRSCPGMRIGFLLCDDDGYVFAMPPLMVEGAPKEDGAPNAIRAAPDQILLLVAATQPEFRAPHGDAAVQPEPPDDLPLLATSAEAESNDRTQKDAEHSVPEIGAVAVPPQQVSKIEERINANPVQDFDLTRIVRVFSAHMQFVEFKVEGAQLTSRTISLPRATLSSIRDKSTRDRMNTTFKLVPPDSKISGDIIRKAANDIRERYLVHHSDYGNVMLKAKRAAFEKEVQDLHVKIERYKEALQKVYQKERSRSKDALVKACWRAVCKWPPKALLARIVGPKPTMQEAKNYLGDVIEDVLPTLDDICAGMKISLVIKDVTWETLNNRDFVDWLRKTYRHAEELKAPFESYAAAKGKTRPSFELS